MSAFFCSDTNHDQRLDLNEFRNLIAQNLGPDTAIEQFPTTSYHSSNSFGENSAVYNDLGGINVSPHEGGTGDAMGRISAASSSIEVNNGQLQYPTNAQGLFQDPNPQVIRRPAPEGPVTYTQNIKIRFLQPPAIPPPGVSAALLPSPLSRSFVRSR